MTAGDIGLGIAFYVLALVAVVGAVGLVAVRNLFHAALFLVLSFVAVAGLYITLNADFVAAAQVLIYAGAVSILLVFAIMLTRDTQQANVGNFQRGWALFLTALVFVVIVMAISQAVWPLSRDAAPQTTVLPIADLLFNKFVLPFEAASVLLLAAMVGAIVIARED